MRQITETLGALGWPEAEQRDAWRPVRAWLLTWPAVVRLGLDYWLPFERVPGPPATRRLQVLPVRADDEPISPAPIAPSDDAREANDKPLVAGGAVSRALGDGEMAPQMVGWSLPLRTVHLVEGFLPVPAGAQAGYPPRAVGEGDTTALRGLWFDSGERLWLWLDRAHDRLYGPDLADRLAWLEAGDVLRVEWAPDVIVLRVSGHDVAVEREETRLVDLDALSELRGGLGESYRRSLQAILVEAPEGLTFAEVMVALRARQGHEVHGGTIRALLHAGRFPHRDGRWYQAPSPATAARVLRRAVVVATLTPGVTTDDATTDIHSVELRELAKSTRRRLREVMGAVRPSAPPADHEPEHPADMELP